MRTVEARHEHAREYLRTHREEIYKITRECHKQEYDWMVSMLGNKCDWCGSQERMELDHVKPKGTRFSGLTGTLRDFYMGKLRVLCHRCHIMRHKQGMMASKWNHLPELYYFE